MAKLKEGYCGICDNVQIFYKENGQIIFTPEYAEIYIGLSNDTITRHGICKSCINNLTDIKVSSLLERIKDSWLDEMVGWANDKQFEQVRGILFTAWNRSEKETIKKHKEKIKIDHEKKVKKKK